MRVLKTIIVIALCFSIITLSVNSVPVNKVSAETVNWGLHVESDGTITLNNKPFYGMGLCVWDAFGRTILDPLYLDYEASFKKINQNKIPFIRVAFCGYYPNAIRKSLDDPDYYFSEMDRVVRTAEKYQIGIIVTLFWTHFGWPDVVGEKVSNIGKRNSKTMDAVRNYIKEVVTRYKNSPAIWGWEVGNEYNLACDLQKVISEGAYPPAVPQYGTPETRGPGDEVSSDDVNAFYDEVAKTIRKYDSYRLITNGDADYRGSQYHLRTEGNWKADTQEQLKEMMKIFSPGNINTISVHIYELDQNRFGRKVGFEELLQIYFDYAKELKKGLYLGEFGAKDDAAMVRQMEAIKKTGLQISTVWNFEEVGMGHGSFSDTGPGSFMFHRTVEMNQYYRSKGLQDTSTYWAKAPKTTNSTTTSRPIITSPNNNKTTNKNTSNVKNTTTVNQDSSTTEPTTIETDTTTSDKDTSSGIIIQSKNQEKLLIDNKKKLIYVVPNLTINQFKEFVQLSDGQNIAFYDKNNQEISDSDHKIVDEIIVKISETGKEDAIYTVKIGDATNVPQPVSNVVLYVILAVVIVLLTGAAVVIILWKKGIIKLPFLK